MLGDDEEILQEKERVMPGATLATFGKKFIGLLKMN
jgi:hypothetical protein